MKKRLSSFWNILKRTAKGWNADDPFAQSAVVSYYAIFSLPALLVLVITVVGFFVEKETVSREISRQVESIMGAQTAETVGEIVNKASETKAGVLASIIAILTIIYGATGVFVQLQRRLNNIWDVKAKPKSGFLKMLKDRLFSFGLILSIGFLLMVSLAISTALAAFSHWLKAYFPDAVAYLVWALDLAVSLAVISFLFALMFKFLPDVRIAWKNIWVGALLTGALFIAGKYGLSLYFGKTEPGSVYGAAGSIVLVMLWASYSSMIVFFGAEFTKQYAVAHGVKITPDKDAEKIKDNTEGKTLAEQGTNKPGESMDLADREDGHAEKKTKLTTQFRDRKGPSDKKETVVNEKEVVVTQKEMDKENKYREPEFKKMKSIKDLKEEMKRLEDILEEEKADIKDDLKIVHLLQGLLPSAMKARAEQKKIEKEEKEKRFTLDRYMREIAHSRISRPVKKTETFFEKVRNRGSLLSRLRKFVRRNK